MYVMSYLLKIRNNLKFPNTWDMFIWHIAIPANEVKKHNDMERTLICIVKYKKSYMYSMVAWFKNT